MMKVPEDHECFKTMTLNDIPARFIKKNGHPQPYQGIAIDSMHGKEFTKALAYSRKVPESDRPMLLEDVNSYFTTDKLTERAVVTFSVRSMLDLYLQVRNYPPGSEIVMTGVNIPDMLRIIKEHGLVAVPVDLDLATLAPSLDDIKRATTPKTKAILFAFIFGATYNIEPYVEFLHSKNIEIIEDCAQSWRSLEQFRGNKHAMMTMFSFGMIKHNTAFYGAVTIIRTP
jgi:perosamine synthetase